MNTKIGVDKSWIWRYLANFWTFVSFVVIIENFRLHGGLGNVLGPVLSIYIAVLAIFSAEKEFERWHWYNKSRHLGEVYVWVWTILVVGMLIATYVTRTSYRLEPEIFSTYVVVLGILAITRKSKEVFFELKERK